MISVLMACFMADRMKDRTLWSCISAAVGILFGGLCFGLKDKSATVHLQHARYASVWRDYENIANVETVAQRDVDSALHPDFQHGV